MSKNSLFSLVVAAGILTLSIAPAGAESLNKAEHEQIGNSAAPDVDPSASRGTDPSIVTQEKEQLGNSAQPDVDPSASQGADKSIVDQERAQLPQ